MWKMKMTYVTFDDSFLATIQWSYFSSGQWNILHNGKLYIVSDPDPNLSCQACSIGFFKANFSAEACEACPAHSTTMNTGSTAATDCLCVAGYTRADDGACEACGVGKFKAEISDGACVSCPDANYHTTLQIASTEQSECVCIAGYSNTTGSGSPCTACPVGTYKNEASHAACSACGPNATTEALASRTAAACMCQAGFSGVYEKDFSTVNMYTVNNIDIYANTLNILKWHASHPLETNASNAGFVVERDDIKRELRIFVPLGAYDVDQYIEWWCTTPGHRSNGMFGALIVNADTPSCTACEIGTYKDTANNTECLACPVPNSSTATTASPSLASCECEPGFTRNASSDTCMQCPIGAYKAELGNTACSSCGAPNSTTLVLGSASRDPCICARAMAGNPRPTVHGVPPWLIPKRNDEWDLHNLPRRQHDHSTSWCHGSDRLPVYGRFRIRPRPIVHSMRARHVPRRAHQHLVHGVSGRQQHNEASRFGRNRCMCVRGGLYS